MFFSYLFILILFILHDFFWVFLCLRFTIHIYFFTDDIEVFNRRIIVRFESGLSGSEDDDTHNDDKVVEVQQKKSNTITQLLQESLRELSSFLSDVAIIQVDLIFSHLTTILINCFLFSYGIINIYICRNVMEY